MHHRGVVLKLHHNETRKSLHDLPNEANQTSPIVVFEHTDLRADSQVEFGNIGDLWVGPWSIAGIVTTVTGNVSNEPTH